MNYEIIKNVITLNLWASPKLEKKLEFEKCAFDQKKKKKRRRITQLKMDGEKYWGSAKHNGIEIIIFIKY